MAMARKGDGGKAVQMMKMMNPIEHSSGPENTVLYGIEPYVVAADIYRLAGSVGKGGWSWYTGSAAWMYRAWVEEILGLKRRSDSLVIDPVIPPSWNGFSMTCRFNAAEYSIVITNPDRVGKGVISIELDGRSIRGNRIPLEKEGKHEARVRMGIPVDERLS